MNFATQKLKLMKESVSENPINLRQVKPVITTASGQEKQSILSVIPLLPPPPLQARLTLYIEHMNSCSKSGSYYSRTAK